MDQPVCRPTVCPVLAAVQGERHRAGCVVAGERGFGDGSGRGRATVPPIAPSEVSSWVSVPDGSAGWLPGWVTITRLPGADVVPRKKSPPGQPTDLTCAPTPAAFPPEDTPQILTPCNSIYQPLRPKKTPVNSLMLESRRPTSGIVPATLKPRCSGTRQPGT